MGDGELLKDLQGGGSDDEEEDDELADKDEALGDNKEMQRIGALEDHLRELRDILKDMNTERGQRAAYELLYGDEFEGELTDICEEK